MLPPRLRCPCDRDDLYAMQRHGQRAVRTGLETIGGIHTHCRAEHARRDTGAQTTARDTLRTLPSWQPRPHTCVALP